MAQPQAAAATPPGQIDRYSRRRPGMRRTVQKNELLRCSDTNGDQRPISRPRLDAAGRRALVDQRSRASRRPAKGGDQNLVVATVHRATALQAAVTQHAQAGTWRSLRPWRSGRSTRALWTRRARRPGITFGARRSLRSRIAFRSLAAAAHGNRERQRKCKTRCTHPGCIRARPIDTIA
jgi:hypothetical protein